VDQPRFATAEWGVKVISLDTGKALFEHNAGKFLQPASNAKLYTGALALDRLGPDFRIRTSLYARSRPSRSGTLSGDLVIYGRGDPSFAVRFGERDYAHLLEPLAEALAQAGVKRIKGGLVADESFFRGPPLGAGWSWEDLQFYYGAEVSALTVQDNVVDLVFRPGPRVGAPCRLEWFPATPVLVFSNRSETVAAGGRSDIDLYRPVGENLVYVTGQLPVDSTGVTNAVAVHEPARWFATMLRETLARRGVKVSGKTRGRNWLEREVQPEDYARWTELASVESPPLREILPRMMKPSQNLYAHLLLLQVGNRDPVAAAGARTTEAAGLAELKRFLEEAGVPRDEVFLEEGSGLSRDAMVTANATVRLLDFMDRHPYAAMFRAALPVAGVDGTLRRRLRFNATEGKVQAKTGTLRFVTSLSGYVTSAGNERLAFSIMLNNYQAPDDSRSARAAIDDIVLTLARFGGHSVQAPE
jgi:D-alanyl-D-alanine carboxypeptidase/D-alanyl-D-alanine-endopeptidase (penicillin-binding protein 4)